MNTRQKNYLYQLAQEEKKQQKNEEYEVPCDFML